MNGEEDEEKISMEGAVSGGDTERGAIEDSSNPDERKCEEDNHDDVPDEDDEFGCKVHGIWEDIGKFIAQLEKRREDDIPRPDIPEKVDKLIETVKTQIEKYSSGEIPPNWCPLPGKESSFLVAIHRLSRLSSSFNPYQSESKFASSLIHINSVMQQCMLLLEEEFRTLLEQSKTQTYDSDALKEINTSDKDNLDGVIYPDYSPETVYKLKKIATTMITAGYETECSQVFSIARRNSFESGSIKHGLGKIGTDGVQKLQWEALEREIVLWKDCFKRSIAVDFFLEWKLCKAVFSGHHEVADGLFCNLTRGVIIQLLNFAESVSMTNRSAEKLFKFLDMYETLTELIPAIDRLFSDRSSSELKSEILSVRSRIGQAAVSMFCELENSIKADVTKIPVPGGAVHPLTRYVLNYLKYACEYRDTLEQIFEQHYKNENKEIQSTASPSALKLMEVMDLLDNNLVAKSKLYKDPSLGSIFLMNNGRYIVQKIKGSKEISGILGDSWRKQRSSGLRQHHKNYQRETWNKVLGLLKVEGLSVKGSVSKPALKERFKTFNATIEEIHKTQSTWTVSDEQLQSELRVSIAAVVIPAYRSFLARFRQYLDGGRQAEKYIKYGPEELEACIDELFDGTPASISRRKM